MYGSSSNPTTVMSLDLSSDQTMLAIAGNAGGTPYPVVTIWNLTGSYGPSYEFDRSGDSIINAKFSSDGSNLFCLLENAPLFIGCV
jgi:hypothetical protein